MRRGLRVPRHRAQLSPGGYGPAVLLTPRYGDHPVLAVDVARSRAPTPSSRSASGSTTLLADLSEDEWRHPSRCDGWSVQDVITHLVSTNGFWALSIQAGLAGEPTRFLGAFDPVASPAQLVDQVQGTPVAETLEQLVDQHGRAGRGRRGPVRRRLGRAGRGPARARPRPPRRRPRPVGLLGARARHRAAARASRGRRPRRGAAPAFATAAALGSAFEALRWAGHAALRRRSRCTILTRASSCRWSPTSCGSGDGPGGGGRRPRRGRRRGAARDAEHARRRRARCLRRSVTSPRGWPWCSTRPTSLSPLRRRAARSSWGSVAASQ